MRDGDIPPEVQALVEALRDLRASVDLELPCVTGPVSAREFVRVSGLRISALAKADAALTAWENRAALQGEG